MNYTIENLISSKEIEKKVEELANKISQDYNGKDILLIGLLRGSCMFISDLARKIDPKLVTTIDFMSVSSYGNSMESTRNVKILKDIEEDVENKEVLIIEDIVDTGRTLKEVYEIIKLRKPKSLKICALLDKPERREIDVIVDYIGFTIPDVFVIGYGIDYAQKHRGLPYIGKVVLKEGNNE